MGEVVFEGVHADMTWQVRVHGDQVDLHSMLHLYRGSKTLAGSGMGGPPLPRGELIHGMRSYSPLTPGELMDARSGDGDRAPAHVLVRAHPDVIAVVVTTERNLRVPMVLSGVVQPWGLSFEVAVLEQGDTTGGLSVYTAAGEVDAPALPHDGHW